MKTLLLATGEAHKLPPLPHGPMLPLLNRPVMAYMLELAGRQEIKQIDIALYQNPGEVEAYFGDGRRWGFGLTYHLQHAAWKDCGAIRWAFNQPDQTILLLPADILIDLDIQAVYQYHQEAGSALTLVAAPADAAAGNLCIDQQGKIDAAGSRWVRPTGVFLVEPDVAGGLPTRKPVGLLEDVLPGLLSAGRPVYVYEHTGYWSALDSFSAYREAQLALLRNLTAQAEAEPSLIYLRGQGRQIHSGIWVGRNSVIHPTVQLAPLVYLHENCQVEKNVVIGPDVVIGRNVIIDRSATLSQSVILENTYIGRLLDVGDKVVWKNLVIDIFSGEYIRIADKFLLSEVQTRYVEEYLRRILELAFTSLFLLLLSPLIILLVVLLLFDGHPVFCQVPRLHMDPDKELAPEQKAELKFNLLHFATRRADGRPSVLRKTIEKLDLQRLPELVNVLKGEITLVGVKPLSEPEVSCLHEEWQMTRFSIPPGFTGLWYVNEAGPGDLDETLVADTYYAAMRSWRTDFQVLAKTPAAWFRKIHLLNN